MPEEYKMTDPKRLLFILSALLFTVAVSAFSPPLAGAQGSFPVFDALLYKNKPDLAQYGLSPIRMVYGQELWNSGESRDNPNTVKIAEVAGKIAPGSLVCVDIEHWPTKGKPDVIKQSIEKFRIVTILLKNYASRIRIGFYSVPPVYDYSRVIGDRGVMAYNQWRMENIKLNKMAEYVDVTFPSLYTRPYTDQATWQRYAIRTLKEAKQYNKPVYPFIWPKRTGSSSKNEFDGEYISAVFWRLQLETCRKYADGIVIWGGWQEQWDENAPWWVETKRFMEGR